MYVRRCRSFGQTRAQDIDANDGTLMACGLDVVRWPAPGTHPISTERLWRAVRSSEERAEFGVFDTAPAPVESGTSSVHQPSGVV